jgi:hypothetical protein
VTRAADLPSSNYSKHLQLILALHPTGNHEFWYYSCNKLMHNSSKTIGNSQDAWEMGKDPQPVPIPVPKGLKE